MITKINF